MKRSDEPLPLSGVRVIEIASAIAGPVTTRHLSDFGAEVVKVESRTHPDAARLAGPAGAGAPGLDNSGYFAAYNAGKLSIALNLKTPAALKILRRLVEVSDVLVEAYRPGAMARLGVTYDTVRQWNPSIIMASHSLQGQDGPHASHGGYGQLVDALSGWLDLTGHAAHPPVGLFSAHADFVSWPFLLSAILLALEVRERTGQGTYIDHSQLESVAYFSAPELLMATAGKSPGRDGNHETYACPSNTYRCRGDDRWCAITVHTRQEWRDLCEILGLCELADDERLLCHADRKLQERHIDGAIAAAVKDWDASDLAASLAGRGIAATEVYRAEDLFDDPQLRHRRIFRDMEHCTHGKHQVLAPSFLIDGVCAGPRSGFPPLGAHTAAICRDLLRMSENEITEHQREGVFV